MNCLYIMCVLICKYFVHAPWGPKIILKPCLLVKQKIAHAGWNMHVCVCAVWSENIYWFELKKSDFIRFLITAYSLTPKPTVDTIVFHTFLLVFTLILIGVSDWFFTSARISAKGWRCTWSITSTAVPVQKTCGKHWKRPAANLWGPSCPPGLHRKDSLFSR